MEKWRDDPEEELVKIFHRSELSTFWTSNIDLIIGPGETLVWIRDGKIEDIVTQTRLKNVAGGFRNWIASKSSGGKEIKMMIIDNKPFEIVIGADGYDKVTPVYEDMPGWSETTYGVTSYDALPKAAKNYIQRLEHLTGVPVDIVSTGPDRNETIVLRHPYDA